MSTLYYGDSIAFEDLFDPDIVGDGPVAANMFASGVPLKFAALKYGQKRADVGHRANNVDVANLWAAKGTANYWGVVNYAAGGTEHPTTSGEAAIGQSGAKLVFQTDGVLHQQVCLDNNKISIAYGDVATSTFVTGDQAAASYQVRYAWAITTNNYFGTGNPQTLLHTQNDAASFTPISSNRVLLLENLSGYITNGKHPVMHGSVVITVTVDLMDPQGRITTKSYAVTLTMYGPPQPTS